MYAFCPKVYDNWLVQIKIKYNSYAQIHLILEAKLSSKPLIKLHWSHACAFVNVVLELGNESVSKRVTSRTFLNHCNLIIKSFLKDFLYLCCKYQESKQSCFETTDMKVSANRRKLKFSQLRF